MGRSSDNENHMLSRLSSTDYARLKPHLTTVRFDVSRTFEEPNKPIKHVCFPLDGLVSVVAFTSGTRQSEVGLIGREGMTGINVVMGGDRSPHLSYVQVPGQAGLRLSADELREAMRERPTIQSCFLHFAQAFMTQATHTAVANGRGKIEERLARWLLMVHDRLSGNELNLTHEFIAMMLNVRRAGVTEALRGLTDRGLITAKRGQIVVTDRSGLEEHANGLYGIPEREYLRLIGWRPDRSGRFSARIPGSQPSSHS